MHTEIGIKPMKVLVFMRIWEGSMEVGASGADFERWVLGGKQWKGIHVGNLTGVAWMWVLLVLEHTAQDPSFCPFL